MTAVDRDGHRPSGAFHAGPPARRLSRKYSRFVSLMKLTLPLSAAALVMLVLAWPDDDPEEASFQLSLAAIPLGEAGDPGMTQARYIGTDGDDNPFVITADSAVPDKVNPQRVTLTTLQADVTLDQGTWVSLTSGSGVYDRRANRLSLHERVDLYADNGFALHTASAHVDLDSGMAAGSDPVTAQGPVGTLRASGFRIEDEGRRIVFSGRVHLTARPGEGR